MFNDYLSLKNLIRNLNCIRISNTPPAVNNRRYVELQTYEKQMKCSNFERMKMSDKTRMLMFDQSFVSNGICVQK